MNGCKAAAERPPIGGCDFPVDPDIAAPDAPVFWRPEIAPAVVSLVASLPDVGLRSFSLANDIIERRNDEHGLSWLRLRAGAELVADEVELDAEALGILIPLDDDWPIRIAAADRLRRRLIERTADPPLTRQRCKRLTRALRTIDGRRTGRQLSRRRHRIFRRAPRRRGAMENQFAQGASRSVGRSRADAYQSRLPYIAQRQFKPFGCTSRSLTLQRRGSRTSDLKRIYALLNDTPRLQKRGIKWRQC